jgi:hypothetical protein
MTNTSAAMFTDQAEVIRMQKQRAELYTRIYQYAAEDFTSIADFQQFYSLSAVWMQSLETQLQTLMQIISVHVHDVPPHSHPIEPHTHISSAPGSPTSPNIGGVITMPTGLVTNLSTNTSQIVWRPLAKPTFINTTLAIPNIEGNKIVVGVGAEGDVFPEQRRLRVAPILLKPTLPPIISSALKGSL